VVELHGVTRPLRGATNHPSRLSTDLEFSVVPGHVGHSVAQFFVHEESSHLVFQTVAKFFTRLFSQKQKFCYWSGVKVPQKTDDLLKIIVAASQEYNGLSREETHFVQNIRAEGILTEKHSEVRREVRKKTKTCFLGNEQAGC